MLLPSPGFQASHVTNPLCTAASISAAGAKLFYLSGMRNGKYMKREVLNLARFISVTKFRPLSWRGAHPYLVADRFEVRQICRDFKPVLNTVPNLYRTHIPTHCSNP